MAIFPTFFLGNIGQENVFYDILERNNAFLGYKNKEFKISQAIKRRKSMSQITDILPKGLSHGFSPKMVFFPTFFLGNIGRENIFYDILEGNSAFLGYKNKMF